ncbi:unnamed protein product [Arabidopsis lyrata]|nr:unnamed protein product [Arabidopsis lyrata]
MRYSKLEKLWDGIKLLRNLKCMDLANSENLKELPNLSMATSLEELNLEGCSSLVELPSSVGNLTNLQKLSLEGCSRLVSLPQLPDSPMKQEISSSRHQLLDWWSYPLLRNLKRMDLAYSENLKELPNFSMATSLEHLDLRGCLSLEELPSSIGDLTNLWKLDLRGCLSLVEVPSSIGDLTNVWELYLSECLSLVELPSSIGNLTNLHALVLKGCSSLVELPSSIGNLTNLHKLSLEGCSRLVSLPQLPDSLMVLNAENCESLEKLDCSFSNPGTWLNFSYCFKLNKEARDLLIQTSSVNVVVLPCKEVPACFTYRGYGSVFCCIRDKLNRFSVHSPIITEHLYIFEVEVEEVTSTELVLDFEIFDYDSKTREIIECGIIHILEHHVDGDEKMAMKMETM